MNSQEQDEKSVKALKYADQSTMKQVISVYSDFYKPSLETLTDIMAFRRLHDAWKKYQETGDSSGYPFVFVNLNGVTVAGSLNPAANHLPA